MKGFNLFAFVLLALIKIYSQLAVYMQKKKGLLQDVFLAVNSHHVVKSRHTPRGAFSDRRAVIPEDFGLHSKSNLHNFILFLLFYFNNCYTDVDNLCRASREN